MIEFRSVTFDYPNGVRALSNITFSAREGDFIFVSGITGSGKSTLLKLIHRQLKATEGMVWVKGAHCNSLSPHGIARLRQRVGFVFQDLKLLEDRTVFENVAFPLDVIGTPGREIHRRVSRMLSHVGLTHKTYKKVEQLSCGEQQRVCIARAVVNSPEILLVDEPTGHLDQDTGWEIMQIFNKINLEGTTMIVATHNQAWVERLGKKNILLNGGRIVEELPDPILLRA